ncbi:type II secretion system protein [Shewanella violacea]|nr:type II secretion system protein [Shewanella violacea]
MKHYRTSDKYQRLNGFTLIELILVIIVLGILAVVAAPRFMDLNRDAKTSSVSGFQGSIEDALKMVHMKAQIDNGLGDNVNLDTQFGSYQFYRGYPETKSEATNPNLYFLETFLQLGAADSESKNNLTRTANYANIGVYEDNGFSRIGYGSGNLLAGLCYAEYFHTSLAQGVSIETRGC